MAKIILTRVDNRLVHGQVGVTWANSLKIDTIVVVDDEAYYDKFSQKLMVSIAKTSNVEISFYKVDEFIHRIKESTKNQQVYLIARVPQTVKRLVENDVEINKVNLGNMHFERGKVALTHKVYVSKEDLDAMEYLLSRDVELYYQDVPGSSKESITVDKLRKVEQ